VTWLIYKVTDKAISTCNDAYVPGVAARTVLICLSLGSQLLLNTNEGEGGRSYLMAHAQLHGPHNTGHIKTINNDS
jgi:hypothetical protein